MLAPELSIPSPSVKVESLKGDLWSRIVAFDLNLKKNPAFTVAARFSRENTNDMGEPLHLAVGTMAIMEFKKFMFLATIEIQEQLKS